MKYGYILILILLLSGSSCRQPEEFTLTLSNCQPEGLTETVQCGSLEVPENYDDPEGKKISIHFIVLPARTQGGTLDPVFCFEGGPGYGTASKVGAWAPYLERLREQRDVVLIDQRGTGKSNPLPCEVLGDPTSAQTYLQDSWPEEFVRNCRNELENDRDLRFYHTEIAVKDIDAIRERLGYNKINIWGISYGGYLAIVYLKNFYSHVRTVFLESPANPYYKFPSTMAADLQEALEKLFTDCRYDPDCRNKYPDLENELYEILFRLQRSPVDVVITNPSTDSLETVAFHTHNLIRGIRSIMMSAAGQSRIPYYIHHAFRNNWQPLVNAVVRRYSGVSGSFMDGMYLCVACTESVPFIDFEDALKKSSGTFYGVYSLEQIRNACSHWIRGNVSPSFHYLPVQRIPVLIMTGDLDPAVRPYEGDILEQSLPFSLHFTIPNNGHGTNAGNWFGCVQNIVYQFISTRSVNNLNTSCIELSARPDWIPPAEPDTSAELADQTFQNWRR